MPRPIRTTAPVYAGSVASQLQASDLWGGITVYTDDRLMDGFIRVGIDDPHYFALHPSGVIPVSRELAYGEVVPAQRPSHNPFDEMLSIENITDDRQVTVRRGTGTTRGDTPLLSTTNWWDVPMPTDVRAMPEQPADHRHAWAVTAMHMDGGVRFDLGCAHCDAVHRNVHRDRMERLIDSNTAPEIERTIPNAINGYHWNTETGDIVPGGHRLPTERWNEGGYERTLFRVEGFRQDGERVASQRMLQISDRAVRNPEHVEAHRQRIIAQLMEECERAGMLRDERVQITERPW